MFRKLLALEVAALASSEANRPERPDTDMPGTLREVFAPRTGNYGSMWSTRSFS